MALNVYLKNEFTEDEKRHNLISVWFQYSSEEEEEDLDTTLANLSKKKKVRHLSAYRDYSSSRINAHSMFTLFPEYRKSIPLFLCGKKLLKNVTLQILNFTSVS